jgi:blocked early in transport 1
LNCVFSSSTRAAPSLRDRSALLGSPSGRSSPFGAQAGQHLNGQRYADDLEGQNDEALEGLSAKVKLLKDVSEFS